MGIQKTVASEGLLLIAKVH